jgi:hypothetical protein
MNEFDTPRDPYAVAASRRADDVERWVRQRAYERAARAAADGPASPKLRGPRMAPVWWLTRNVAAAMMPRTRAPNSAPAQPHH